MLQTEKMKQTTYSYIIKELLHAGPNSRPNSTYDPMIIVQDPILSVQCPYRRCGSNEYLQSMFLSRNKKNNVYPCKPQWGIKGSNLYRYVFVMSSSAPFELASSEFY